jgi:hypothetical protein
MHHCALTVRLEQEGADDSAYALRVTQPEIEQDQDWGTCLVASCCVVGEK